MATIIFPDGEYIGHIRNKKREGNGTMIYLWGDMYRGEWKNDKKDGFGMMIYGNGEKYQGYWKKDKKHGNGIIEYLDGEFYDGEWEDDNPKRKSKTKSLKTVFKHIPINTILYNPFTMDETEINEYLKETKDNILINSVNSYYPLNKDIIQHQVQNPMNVVYECYQANGRYLEESNVNKETIYLRLNSLGIPGDFISISSLISIFKDKSQIFTIVPTEKKLESVVSVNVLENLSNGIGASHCQEGQGGYVYEFKKIVRAYSKRSRKNIPSITKKKKSNSISKKKKSYHFSVR
jgi:hypothetical protein